MGDVGSTAQCLLEALAHDSSTKSVKISIRDNDLAFAFLHYNGEYEIVEVLNGAPSTMNSLEIQDVLVKVRKHADSIKLDEYGWMVGTTC